MRTHSNRVGSTWFDDSESGAESRESEEHALRFVRIWAEEVLRQVKRVKEVRRSARASARMHGDEPGITTEYLEEEFRKHWAAEHMLLWTAHQLERWRKRLDLERDEEPRPPDRRLQLVRNALEHLDEADFREGRAEPPPKKSPSLRALGGLDMHLIDGDETFCGIDTSDIHTRALEIVRSVEDDLEDEAVERLLEAMRGR